MEWKHCETLSSHICNEKLPWWPIFMIIFQATRKYFPTRPAWFISYHANIFLVDSWFNEHGSEHFFSYWKTLAAKIFTTQQLLKKAKNLSAGNCVDMFCSCRVFFPPSSNNRRSSQIFSAKCAESIRWRRETVTFLVRNALKHDPGSRGIKNAAGEDGEVLCRRLRASSRKDEKIGRALSSVCSPVAPQ